VSSSVELAAFRETASPATPSEAAREIRRAAADRLPVYPVGGATALDCPSAPDKEGLGLMLGRLNRIIDYAADDLTITVEAGVTLEQLNQTLAQRCQRLPVDLWQPQRTTVGGLVATDWAGPRQFGYGTVRDYVLGVRAVDGRGEEFAAGGRVVKNAAGYNLARLLVGSWGTLAVITEVSLMVRPAAAQSALLLCRPRDFAHAEQLLAQLQGGRVLPVAVELLAGRRRIEEVSAGAEQVEQQAQEETEALCLIAGFEGPAAEVDWMLHRLSAQWRELGAGAGEQVRGRDAERLWARLTDFAPHVEIRTLPGQVTRLVEQLVRLDTAGAYQAHAGNGVVLARFSWSDPAELAAAWREQLRPLVAQADGRLVLRRGPAGLELDAEELWTTSPAALRVMGRIKTQFDPEGILNPGRLGYETAARGARRSRTELEIGSRNSQIREPFAACRQRAAGDGKRKQGERLRTCKRIISPLRGSILGGRGSQRSEVPGSNTFTSPYCEPIVLFSEK